LREKFGSVFIYLQDFLKKYYDYMYSDYYFGDLYSEDLMSTKIYNFLRSYFISSEIFTLKNYKLYFVLAILLIWRILALQYMQVRPGFTEVPMQASESSFEEYLQRRRAFDRRRSDMNFYRSNNDRF